MPSNIMGKVGTKRLLEEIGVAAIPPTSFYENREAGRFLARFAFCKTMDVLEAGVERLGKLTGRV